MKPKQIHNQHIFQIVLIFLIIAIMNFLGSFWSFRWDLTEEKKHSLSETTIEMLKDLDDIVYVKVYLDGDDLPSAFRQLQRKIRETLDDYRRYSSNVEYEFIDLNKEMDLDTRYKIYDQLQKKGLIPTQVEEGGTASYKQQMVFPGAIISYGESEYPVNLLENDGNSGPEKKINTSISRVEQHLTQAMLNLIRPQVRKIAFIEGHDELDEYQTMDIMYALSEYYQIERLSIDGVLGALDSYEAVVFAKPNSRVSEKDKFVIDQYIMNGGKALWLVEWMQMDMDSLKTKMSSVALIKDFNLDDLLFNYGVRINPDLIQDMNCLSIPVTVNQINGKPQFEPRPWPYFPAIISENNHIITKNLSVARTAFVSSIDTVGDDNKIKKTVLLKTSEFSRSLGVPIDVSLDVMRNPPDPKLFMQGRKSVAVLLEGEFHSNFDMRIPPEIASNKDVDFKMRSVPTRQIVISDGDMIRNYVKVMGVKKEPYQLGSDQYYQNQFTPGNKEFILNCMNYLTGDNDIIKLRMREIKMRLLDHEKVRREGIFWVTFNTVVPILIVLLFGLGVFFMRKLRYGESRLIVLLSSLGVFLRRKLRFGKKNK
jgi:ABC-2 type transport system permease protein